MTDLSQTLAGTAAFSQPSTPSRPWTPAPEHWKQASAHRRRSREVCHSREDLASFLTRGLGCPVALSVFEGGAGDSKTRLPVKRLRNAFPIAWIIRSGVVSPHREGGSRVPLRRQAARAGQSAKPKACEKRTSGYAGLSRSTCLVFDWTGIPALGGFIAIHEFDHGERRVVAIAEARLEDAGIAAGPVMIAGA